MCFYFSHLTCTFHFNCCLNKIFVIVIVIVINYHTLSLTVTPYYPLHHPTPQNPILPTRLQSQAFSEVSCFLGLQCCKSKEYSGNNFLLPSLTEKQPKSIQL